MINHNQILNTDAFTVLQGMPAGIIQCIVTSPPYFGLRAYGTPPLKWPAITYTIMGLPISVGAMECELGLEPDHFAFIGHLVLIFREARRVLKDDGIAWVNMGDSYAGYHGNSKVPDDQAPSNKNGYIENMRKSTVTSTLQGGQKTQLNSKRAHETISAPSLKPKDLIGIPWMLAFALRDDGWYLRQDIIWHKPNPMPESVFDRCTKSHEYIFLLSKSKKYYYDHKSIMTTSVWDVRKSKTPDGWDTSIGKGGHGSFHKNGREKGSNWNGSSFDSGKTGEMKETHGHTRKSGNKTRKPGSARGLPDHGAQPDLVSGNVASSVPWEGMYANKRSVWTVTTKPFKEAHFATFPEDLIVDMIKAGSKEGDLILDPFMGAGTTAIVARKLYRNYLGFELNQEYIKIAEARIARELGMFA